MADGINIKVTGVKETLGNLKKYQVIKTEAVKIALKETGFKVQGDAKKNCPVDTGRLRASLSTNWSGSPLSEGRVGTKAQAEDGVGRPLGPPGLVVVTGTNVNYACVIGSRQQVYEPINRTSANIGNYPHGTVLSKDGESHRIIKKYRFYEYPLSAISIRIRKGRNPLVVTKTHLLLIVRDGYLIWEQAQNLKLTDQVIIKRPNNYISDNSNKTLFICPCGNQFWIETFNLKHRIPKYCSLKCRHKYGPHDQNIGMRWILSEEQREKHRGENNPQWRDGSSRRKYPPEFNNYLKQLVKERDKYRCQLCGNVENLVVHHIDWDKMNNDINNLITLCQECHGGLNRIDCELPIVNWDIFKTKDILEIQQYNIIRKKKEKTPYIYDFSIENENSYVCSGVLIHNSYVEFGSIRALKWGGYRSATSKLYLSKAYHKNQPELVLRLKKIFKK